MRLWTFQATEAIKLLKKQGVLNPTWDRYERYGNWRRAYQWMAEQMEYKGISCGNHAPVWAWHSCNKYGQAPSIDDARSLLADVELEAGIETIEFECPDELVLLSRYNPWNIIIEHLFEEEENPVIPPLDLYNLYDTGKPKLVRYQAIQATMPYLKLDWVIDIRPLKLKPEQYEGYNEWELV